MNKFPGKNGLQIVMLAFTLFLCLFNLQSPHLPYLLAGFFAVLMLVADEHFSIREKIASSGKGWYLLAGIGFLLCLLLRISLFKFESGDYLSNLSLWYDKLDTEGFRALKEPFHDYPPSYMYLMWILTLLPIHKLFALKLLSLAFEALAAFFIFRIIRTFYPQRKAAAMAAVFCFLLLPTVVFNGALWGQCDVIFTSLLLGFIFYSIRERFTLAMVFFGLAFAFKLQSIFLILLPLALWMGNKISARHILWVPAIFILGLIPNYIVGRPFLELLFVYKSQAGHYTALTQFAPSVYQFFGWAPSEPLAVGGILFTATLVFLFTAWVWKTKPVISPGFIIHTATLSAILIPFFLPKMHDRYFFLADVLTLLYAFYKPRRYYVPVLVGLSSLFCYFYFLFSAHEVFSFKIMSGMMLLALIIVARDFTETYIAPDLKEK